MKTKGIASLAIFSLLMICAILASSVTHAVAGPNHVPGRYIVVLNDEVSGPPAVANQMAAMHGLGLGHIYRHAIKGYSCAIPDHVIEKVKRDPRVKYVEQDAIYHAVVQTLPTGVDRIDAELNATANIDGSDDEINVDIAIIDSGIDTDHPDLRVASGMRFYTITGGPPWNRGTFSDDNYDDDNGHGTHVAGTAAAIDNNYGVVGVAPGARLWAVKVLGANGSGPLSDIIAGIDWVTENAAQIEVANMSLGGHGFSTALRTAIQNSVAKGIVYVVAAGNDAQDVYGLDGTFGTADDFIPAAYPEAAAISAMADTDGQPGGTGGPSRYGEADDSMARFSNYSGSAGAGNPVTSPGAAIDLALPGVDILSTYLNGGYAIGDGTSMASPHAAGLAALYIAANGRASDADGVYAIRQALIDQGVAQTSTQGLASLNDPDGNEENIGWAGEPADPPPTVSITSPNDGAIVSGTITIEAVASDDAGVTQVEFFIDGSETPLATVYTSPYTCTWDTTAATDSTHTITATATDMTDQTASDSISVTVDNTTPSNEMHVSDITMQLGTRGAGRNVFTRAIATITIVDAGGSPVEGATVYGKWTEATSDSDTGVTDSEGKVTVESDEAKNAAPGTTFIITITDVAKSGWTYESSANSEASDSITK